MLSRLYIDNFRSFVDFEFRPSRKQLIFGHNGSGKTSLLDALLLLRQFAVRGDLFDNFFILNQRTRWLDKPQQTCELEAVIEGDTYVYRIVVEPWGEPRRPRVASETVHCSGNPIFEFINGEVHLYNDRFEHKVTYPFDWHRSGLATITERKDNQILTRFRRWLGTLFCFKINPFAMGIRADGENLYPNLDLSNIAAWYRHLLQAYPQQNAALLGSLREAMDDFNYLQLEPAGENVRLLVAEFIDASRKSVKFGLNELSDGQRCLICLYVILHFVLAKGSTVILDEPENFVSLREIQPWLLAVTDILEEGSGQLLLISHHPELINQWAPCGGVQFARDGCGAVRVEDFKGDSSSHLSPAELVARGWEH